MRILLALAVLTTLLLPTSLRAIEPQAAGESGGGDFRLEEPLPLFEPGTSSNAGNHENDGWLIVNPRTRHGYQIFRLDKIFPEQTALWSFDLDTLQPLRRAVIEDFRALAGGAPGSPGEMVHAVDEEGGQIFLAGMSGSDPKEMQVAVIDEERLDGGLSLPETVPGSDFVTRRLPVPPSQRAQILTTSQGFFIPSVGGTLRGMTFSRETGSPKLLLIFGTVDVNLQLNNHWLVQWDPERAGIEYGDWIVRLSACERSFLVPFQGWKYQLGILRGKSAISVGCTGTSGAQAVRFPLLALDGQPDPNGVPNEALFDVFPLPRLLANVLADPQSERLLFQVQLSGLTWWVFDARAGTWVGAVGETLNTGFEPGAGIDPASGRLYSLVPDHTRYPENLAVQGGFHFSDTRLTPVPQMTNAIPSLAYFGNFRIWVDPETPERARRVFVRRGSGMNSIGSVYPDTQPTRQMPYEEFYLVIEDTISVPVDPSPSGLDTNTTNVPEEPGITGAKFDAGGSGFGFRNLLVSGVQAIISRDSNAGPCYNSDRDMVFGQVENASLSNLSASAASLSLSADEATKADLEAPSSRCLSLPQPVIDSSLGQLSPFAEDDYRAQCTGDEGKVEAPTPEGSGPVFSSWAECKYSEESVEAFSSGRLTAGGDAAPVSVMHATSHVTARRSEDGGTIVEVEAIARGIDIAGVGTIGVVRTVAVARSAGLPKTAEAPFDRFICGVDMPGFKVTSCLTAAQEKQFVDGLNQLMVRMNGKARLREPDPDLSKGTDGGYLAAVQKDRREALGDKLVTRDFSETVPGLEIIFYRGDDQRRGAGRQVFQFAAVQASSAYGIFCLFGESPNSAEGETSCVRPTSELKVQLTDDFEENPTPLPGGVFQIHLDEDGDGILGVDDAVLELGDEEAVCTTTVDGVGDCVFELPPGKYIVHQVKAPDGFAPSPDCAAPLPAFTSTTCEFANSPNIGLIYVGLTDDSPEASPLSGGVFELYVDNGDQTLGKGDTKLASCTTDVFGDCVYKLPDINGKALPIFCAGSPIESEELQELIQIECIFDPDKGGNILAVELGTFIVHQAVAPPEYSVAEDQVLPLAKPWDIGIASFVNGLAPVEGTPPIEGTPSRQSTVVIEGGSAPRAPVKQSAPRKEPQPPKIITRIVTAPSEAISFLLRHPKQAAMFASIWLLLVAPLWLVWRRRSISTLKGAA